jgi:hypothetical protein
LDGRTDEKRKNARDAPAERLVPSGIVSIDLENGNASMETEFRFGNSQGGRRCSAT